MTFGDSITQFSVIAAVLLIAVVLSYLFPADNREWHASGDSMRRKIKGRWQYRPMTEGEFLDKLDEKTW